jgi:hypothetical protein
VIDNHHGAGFDLKGERVWWMVADCPLHGSKPVKDAP